MGYIAASVTKLPGGHRVTIDAPGVKFCFSVLADGKIMKPNLESKWGTELIDPLMADPFVIQQIEKCRRLEALGL